MSIFLFALNTVHGLRRKSGIFPIKAIMTQKQNDREKETLQMKIEVSLLREENARLRDINRMNSEGLKEHCRLFRILRPPRIPISADRKLYIAGLQLFRCKAIHGKESCPRWMLPGCEGSFGPEGFEIHHELEWSVGYQNTGVCVAVCHACHALAHRHARMKAAESQDAEQSTAPVVAAGENGIAPTCGDELSAVCPSQND